MRSSIKLRRCYPRRLARSMWFHKFFNRMDSNRDFAGLSRCDTDFECSSFIQLQFWPGKRGNCPEREEMFHLSLKFKANDRT